MFVMYIFNLVLKCQEIVSNNLETINSPDGIFTYFNCKQKKVTSYLNFSDEAMAIFIIELKSCFEPQCRTTTLGSVIATGGGPLALTFIWAFHI